MKQTIIIMLALLLGAAGASAQNKIYNLSTVTTDDYPDGLVLQDGDVLTGTLNTEDNKLQCVHIFIAAGAHITLCDMEIKSNPYKNAVNYSGLTCLGNATITLHGTNVVKGLGWTGAGIQVGPPGTTLTIDGTGQLDAEPSIDWLCYGSGIGGIANVNIGAIVINSGIIKAIGSSDNSGIGSGYKGSCDGITINGGTINAYSVNFPSAAPIGCGRGGSCSFIKISGGNVSGRSSGHGAGIGSGAEGICGAITITGGNVDGKCGEIGAGAGIGSGEEGQCGDILITSDVISVRVETDVYFSQLVGAGKDGTCGSVTLPEGFNMSGYTYTYSGKGSTPVALTPDETRTVWTLDAIPGDNVELTAEYYPYAHVVAPKAAENVEFGTTDPLVTGGSSLGGKLMYAVTPATATAAPDPITNASAWSENVPTADKLTFAGAAKVWYYVSGDDYHSNTAPADPVAVTITRSIAGGVPYIVATMTDGWTIGDGVKAFLPNSYEYGASEITLTELAGAPQDKVVILGNAQEDEALPAEIALVPAPDDESAVEKSYSDAFEAMDKKHFAITDGTLTLGSVIANDNTGLTASDAIVMVLKDGKFKAVDISQNDLGQNAKSGVLLFILSKWEYLNVGSNAGGSTNAARSIGIGDGGETTRIRPPLTPPTQEGKWYDLQGRRMQGQPVRKGVYVRNGTKVVIK